MKIKPIVIVGTNAQGNLIVSGDLTDKKMLLNALADGIKVVANYKEKKIIKPHLIIKGN